MVRDNIVPGPSGKGKDVTIGHEATGTVVKVGSEVTRFKIGDEVGFINAYGACFNCKGCAVHYFWCEGGKFQMQGFEIDGFFAEYSKINPKAAVVLPKGMDASKAAPIFCAGITCK
jgi:D-arabinose 1-dehydrogenase-like Zn-dependent alcohol dehydrogenase